MTHVSGAEILRRQAVNLRDLARQGNGLGYWTGGRANRNGFRFRSHFHGLRYEGQYAKGMDTGRIDDLFSLRLRNGNALSTTDRLEARALGVRDRLGPFGMEAGTPRASFFSHASVCGKRRKTEERGGKWIIGVRIRYVPLQPNIRCRIRGRSRLQVTAARVPQC